MLSKGERNIIAWTVCMLVGLAVPSMPEPRDIAWYWTVINFVMVGTLGGVTSIAVFNLLRWLEERKQR